MSSELLTLKEEWTRRVLEIHLSNGYSYDEAMQNWWVVNRNSGGLRLTGYGDQAFKLAGLQGTAVEIEFSKSRNELWLLSSCNKFLKSPYYFESAKFTNNSNKVEKPKVVIYDDDIAITMVLYGSLTEYLEHANLN